MNQLAQRHASFNEDMATLSTVVRGKPREVRLALCCLLCRGHEHWTRSRRFCFTCDRAQLCHRSRATLPRRQKCPER